MSGSAWQNQRERGSALGIALIAWLALRLGRRGTGLLLWPVVLYFTCTGVAARQAAQQYLRRLLGRDARLSELLRLFHNFAICTLDRLLIHGGRATALEVSEHWLSGSQQLACSGRGCIILTSHVGSFEVLSWLGGSGGGLPRLRVLLDRGQGRMLTGLLERLNPGFVGSVIDAGQPGPQLMLALREALDEGCNLGIMADRMRGSEASVEVQFLGGTARLPAAIWSLAAILGVPVLMAFGVYRGGVTYDAYFEVLSERIEGGRAGRRELAAHWAQAYAERLEVRVRDAPYNWFNFFPFWLDEPQRK